MKNVRYKVIKTKKSPLSISSYKTSDLYLSAFLKSKGIALQSTNIKNGKVIFIFKDKGNIQDLISRYFNNSDVGVLSYKAALRDLHSIIFNYKNSTKYHEE